MYWTGQNLTAFAIHIFIYIPLIINELEIFNCCCCYFCCFCCCCCFKSVYSVKNIRMVLNRIELSKTLLEWICMLIRWYWPYWSERHCCCCCCRRRRRCCCCLTIVYSVKRNVYIYLINSFLKKCYNYWLYWQNEVAGLSDEIRYCFRL